MLSANFELTIWFLETFNETTAKDYFDILTQKISTQELAKISFQETNTFFLYDEERGVKFS
jgi:hypothetical protein